MKNTFVWMQLTTTDTKKAQDFYGQLFTWNFSSDNKEKGTYADLIIDAGEGRCGGIDRSEKDVSLWVPFVNVEDLQASTEKAKALGAEIVVSIKELENNYGSCNVLKDPTGAVFGMYMEPKEK